MLFTPMPQHSTCSKQQTQSPHNQHASEDSCSQHSLVHNTSMSFDGSNMQCSSARRLPPLHFMTSTLQEHTAALTKSTQHVLTTAVSEQAAGCSRKKRFLHRHVMLLRKDGENGARQHFTSHSRCFHTCMKQHIVPHAPALLARLVLMSIQRKLQLNNACSI